MEFSNKFKIAWWVILLLVLTGISIWRLCAGVFNNCDIIIFVFWFILVLFPIISEISLFGISVKKDIEEAKNELKNYLAEIKMEINNKNIYRPTVIVNGANKEEYKEKIEQEIANDNKAKKETLTIEHCEKEIKKTENEKVKERIEKLINIEKLVNSRLRAIYGNNYAPQMKINNDIGKQMIADGIIYKDGKINELVEIKYVSSKSFNALRYICVRFLNRVVKLGLKIPKVKFVIVSPEMDEVSATAIKNDFSYLNFVISDFKDNLPRIAFVFFKQDNSALVEIKPENKISNAEQ
jgi:hypothetical protein